MQSEFNAKLERITELKGSDLIVKLSPKLIKMPLPMKRHDDPFLPFGKAIVSASRDLVVGYMFDLAAYLRLGAAGAIALERTLSYAFGENLLILHGAFAGQQYAEITDENAFASDAVTVLAGDHVVAYLQREDRNAFVIREGVPQLVVVNDPATYWYQSKLLSVTLSVGRALQLRVIGDEVVYADSGEDYVRSIQYALEGLHSG